jgi:hypothetical protein
MGHVRYVTTDDGEFAGVEPYEIASRASVDHSISSAAVGMRLHAMVAAGTGNAPPQFGRIERLMDIRGRDVVRPALVDDATKGRALGKKSATLDTICGRFTFDERVTQTNVADRAIQRAVGVQRCYPFIGFIGKMAAAAVRALKVTPVPGETQSRSARRAVHDGDFRCRRETRSTET